MVIPKTKALLSRFAMLLASYLSLAVMPHAALEPSDPKPGQIIRYDARNCLTYANPRQDNQRQLILKYQVDGTSQTWNLTPLEQYPIGTQHVYEIRYLDAHHAWLLTHMGKRFGGAVLLNLKSRDVEKGYAIQGPQALSPDGHKFAYCLPLGHQDLDRGVVINNVAIYPAVKMIGPAKERPDHCMDLIEAPIAPQGRKVVSEVHRIFDWMDHNTFRFIVEERPESRYPDYQQTGTFYNYTVTGLAQCFEKTPADLKSIKVTRKQISSAEALARFNSYFQSIGQEKEFADWALKKRLEAEVKEKKQ